MPEPAQARARWLRWPQHVLVTGCAVRPGGRGRRHARWWRSSGRACVPLLWSRRVSGADVLVSAVRGLLWRLLQQARAVGGGRSTCKGVYPAALHTRRCAARNLGTPQ